MTGQFEESELIDVIDVIDVIEVRYEVVQVKQQKYVCRCGSCIETALGPERTLPGSRYSLAFAIKVILDKWLDHIPLERQYRILDRHGLIVTSQTLWDLAYAIAKRLTLVDAALSAHVLQRPVIGLDQTGWPRLESAGSKPWHMWCLTALGVVVCIGSATTTTPRPSLLWSATTPARSSATRSRPTAPAPARARASSSPGAGHVIPSRSLSGADRRDREFKATRPRSRDADSR